MKKKYMLAAVLSLVLASGILAQGMAASIQPGSTSDPLVSKSYVDDRINQLLSMIGGGSQPVITQTPTVGSISGTATDEIVTDVMAQIKFLYGDKIGTQAAFVPVNATKGQILLGGEGAEIILRSGKAVGFCNGTDGVVDTTDGAEIFNGAEIKANHLIIVPRSDGRGAAITEDAWFIVKGSYSISTKN